MDTPEWIVLMRAMPWLPDLRLAVIHRVGIVPSRCGKNVCTISNMSDEVEAEPAWKSDPLFAHMDLTEEGVARWRERFKELDKTKKQEWADLRARMGLKR
jgi:hypothetical protein